MKATIVYYSHRGKTAQYAREIALYLWTLGISVKLSSISDFKPESLQDCDLLMLGCWTSGWFVVNQHPHPKWIEFAQGIRGSLPKHVLLFSTYKLRTGSLFTRMSKALGLSREHQTATLRSKTGLLSAPDKEFLTQYVASIRAQQ